MRLVDSLAIVVVLAALTSACGGSTIDDDPAAPEPDASVEADATEEDAATPDADTPDAVTADTDPGTDAVEDAGGSSTFDIAATFYECETDADCEPSGAREQICVSNVCVIPPSTQATLSNDEGSSPVASDESVELSCYADDGLFQPAGDDTPVAVAGILERFGSGPPTNGLCVTIYDENVLLPWLVNNECNGLIDEDDDAYIGCWQLDPCRCLEQFGDNPSSVNDALVDGANAGLEEAGFDAFRVEDLDTCNAYIGYCEAIADADVRSACEARVQALSLSGATRLIVGHTRSVENPEDLALEEPEGTSLFRIDNVPANLRFAFKVSGRENRWRDTWEYGMFTRGDLDVDGVFTTGANVVSDGAWNTIPPAVGRPNVDDRNGAVAGVVRDCGTDTRNPWAIVHATVGIAFNEGSVLSYFNGNPDNRLPLAGRDDSNILGTFAAIDLPAGPNRVAPIICAGDCANRDDLVFAGGKNVFQTPKSVIIATFEGFFAP
jgi:hypothetical protein